MEKLLSLRECAQERVVVENNFLSVTQLDNFAQKARMCEGAACQQLIQDMVDTNLKQQKEMLELCSSQPDQCGNKYGYLVDQWDVFDKAIKQLDADGKLPNEFKNYLSAVYSSSMEAEGTAKGVVFVDRELKKSEKGYLCG